MSGGDVNHHQAIGLGALAIITFIFWALGNWAHRSNVRSALVDAEPPEDLNDPEWGSVYTESYPLDYALRVQREAAKRRIG